LELGASLVLGAWCFSGAWCLVLGALRAAGAFGVSLELGALKSPNIKTVSVASRAGDRLEAPSTKLQAPEKLQ
jgi:hypothetical protein